MLVAITCNNILRGNNIQGVSNKTYMKNFR